MKFLEIYKTKYGLSNQEDVFDFLTSNLTDSIKYWDYFVNWNKVKKNVRNLEIDLNVLNYLVGKDDIENELKTLLTQYPSVANLLPILLACREKDFKILTNYTGGILKHETFEFSKKSSLSSDAVESYVRFAKNTGLLEIFQKKIVKSVPDYVIGIEVGLDSNGRKNRGGTAMEKISESFIKAVCDKHQFEYLTQANAKKIKQEWNLTVNVDKSRRIFDFAIRNVEKLFLIETNYYGKGGSKLKATAGEYKTLFDFIKSGGNSFVWITDGLGWETALMPLKETFEKTDFTLNLKMVTDGVLDEVLLNG